MATEGAARVASEKVYCDAVLLLSRLIHACSPATAIARLNLKNCKARSASETLCDTCFVRHTGARLAGLEHTMDALDKQKRLSLLLVDDDAELCTMMKEFFAEAGHHVDCACTGAEGLTRALNGAYDLVILDVMLPTLDGFSVLEQLRRRKDLPVIMLTARVQQKDRIRGLDAGADDYLPKPFDPDELLARVRAVMRRTESLSRAESASITIGNLRVEPGTREVWCAEVPVELTEMEFELLAMLIRSAGRVVSRDEITAALFEREASPYDRFLDVHISHLRKKLERSRGLIRTIRGVGYIFTAAK